MKINSAVKYDRHIIVCTNFREGENAVCCHNGGGLEIYKKLKEYIKSNEFEGRVKVTQARCFSMCADGPNLVVYPEQIWVNGVKLSDVTEIIEKYIAPFLKK